MKPYQDLAFPFSPNQSVGGGGMMPDRGMTLRDYFASNATDTDIAPYLNDYENLTHMPAISTAMGSYAARLAPTRISIEAARYMFADAMMEARK